jgi:hypothetical protein
MNWINARKVVSRTQSHTHPAASTDPGSWGIQPGCCHTGSDNHRGTHIVGYAKGVSSRRHGTKACGNQGFRRQIDGRVRHRYLGKGNRFDPERQSRRDQSGALDFHAHRFAVENGIQVREGAT